MANYSKGKGEKLRCKACGIAFEYNRGVPAKKSLAMHVGMNKNCNRYYNEEAIAASRRRKHGPKKNT